MTTFPITATGPAHMTDDIRGRPGPANGTAARRPGRAEEARDK